MGLHKLTQALMLVLAPLCVQAADTAKPVVNLYIWGEYLAPDTLSNFEKKTGIHVVADHFDSLETVETKLLTGRSGYDLVLTAGQHLSRAIQSGAIQTLDRKQTPHFQGVGEEFRQHMAVFDPGNRYAGIYAWGTTGVGYQEEAVKQRLPEVRTVFIAPPTWDTLKDRLVGRGTETAEQMTRRLRTAETELALAAEFDHVVVNDDLGRAVAELVELLGL